MHALQRLVSGNSACAPLSSSSSSCNHAGESSKNYTGGRGRGETTAETNDTTILRHNTFVDHDDNADTVSDGNEDSASNEMSPATDPLADLPVLPSVIN